MNSEILYKRLIQFSIDCLSLVRKLSKTNYNEVYGKQLIRSSGAPGADYIEAIEASSRKEFTHKLKLCRRESKESVHWLLLIQNANNDNEVIVHGAERLIKEARELIRIFAASILTSEKNRGIEK